ncbi:MAG: TRAP transporter permease, partial [Candidatus Latescibacterota bacterium]
MPNHTPLPTEDIGGEVVTPQRTLTGKNHTIVFVVGILLSLFHLWSNAVGVLPEIQSNAIHFGLILFLGYLQYPISRKKDLGLGLDYGLAILAILTALYLIFFEDALHNRNEVPNTTDLIFAGMALLLLLEITRRTTGLFIPILA